MSFPLIRLVTPADASSVASIYEPAVTTGVTSFELEAPDDAEMARRIERVLARTPWLVCEHDGAVIGYAYANTFRERAAYQWSVEVSAYVRGDVHRAGVGRALYTSLFAVLVLQGFQNAYAGVALPNTPSVGLHEAVGFARVGVYRGVGFKFGGWHDVLWFERAIGPRPPDPVAPTPITGLRDADALRAAMASGLPLLRLRSEASDGHAHR